MTNQTLTADQLPAHSQWKKGKSHAIKPYQTTAALITKAASSQTYYTIRFLVDRDRVGDAYCAYAYFRWVDDCLDEGGLDHYTRLAFIHRQQHLIERAYHDDWPTNLTAEEHLLIDLIRADPDPNNGLHRYIRHMISVMAFDADRQGRLISQDELDTYTHHLAVGVTEALHYFIGHNDPSPQTPDRYAAVSAAHITHMLRDTLEDFTTDYVNIPREVLDYYGIQPTDIHTPAYRAWVKNRVQLARAYFKSGENYLSHVNNRRCRLAGYAYIARFKGVLDTIERDNYQLRPHYHERNTVRGKFNMLTYIFSHILRGGVA